MAQSLGKDRTLAEEQTRVVLIAVLLACAPAARALTRDNPEPATEKRTVVAGEKYRAGGLHRLVLGRDYRDLWTAPIEVDVLDLTAYAGGLRPVRRVGGQETKGLAMKGADGRDYTFRGVDKDPSEILPPDLRDTFAESIVQDQIAAGHPAGSLVMPPIMEAAGILHTEPRLVVMPDDPALGEFQKLFGGLLGTIEVYPRPVSADNPGFAGASEIISGDEMWKRVDQSAENRIDARAFLTARLVDILVGDWDRHRKQWRWARVPGKAGWQPIPEDRDQAFSRFEGLMLSVARSSQPRLLNFGPDYPGMEGLAYNGWEQDHWILADLERPVWEETAAALEARITNEVIEAGVRRLPPEYQQLDGARLTAALKKRRDDLPELAARFYRRLAAEVDVRCTDQDDLAEVVRQPGGDVEVRVASGAFPARPYFLRRFQRNETREIRIDLRGGNDRFVSRGGPGGISVRAIGGDGNDVVDDSAGGGTRFSDSSPENRVLSGPGTKHDTREYVPPPPNANAPWIPPRHWGRRTVPVLWLGGSPDVGVFVGGGFATRGFGFRKDPFGDRQKLRGGYAAGAQAFRFDYDGEFRFENSPWRASLAARASGIEILRFYGFGNETSSAGADESFKVEQQQYSLTPSMSVALGRRASVSFGPTLQYSTTELDPGRLITRVRPYGGEDFGQVGASLELQLDTRDRPAAASRGVFMGGGGRFFPKAWDVKSAFGEIHGEAATYLTPTRALTLAVRAGGKRVFGDYPFQEAAFIGGGSTLRGFRPQRFAGDAAVYASAELRVFLTRFFCLLPGELGVVALTDVGRVYFEGESSDRWHTAAGGGLWLAFLNRANTLTVTVARSKERTGLYVRGGFAF